MTQESVAVVGAGLVGCLAALAFAAKGHKVQLFELRPDPKNEPASRNLRSINLAVSDRGIRALKYVDETMAERVLKDVIPMHGRMIHDLNGHQESQTYGLFGESINSIDRKFLNDSMLDEIRGNPNIELKFDHKLVKIAMKEKPELTFQRPNESKPVTTQSFDYIIGADGAHSQFRYQLQRSMRLNVSQEYIDMQYLELNIPSKSDSNGSSVNGKDQDLFHFSPNHLHIWPRHKFMLIALANEGGSFTSTFFSPWEVIELIKSDQEFVDFFHDQFPDAVELLGDEQLRQTYNNLPRGSLMQVSTYPYHHPSGQAIIIGDAAHSMVPFYGQGMNCGFEDVRVLMELIDANNGSIKDAFKAYSPQRKKDLETICKLALDNYKEMSSHVTSNLYLFRKKIDYFLGKYGNGRFFQWIPMYTMISFRGDIPYSRAVEIEAHQERVLKRIEFATIGIIGAVGAARLWNYFRK